MYGKLLGIDYGTVRTGIAITDESNKIAFRLEIVPTKGFSEKLEDLIKKYNIEVLVIGSPLGLEGKPTQISKQIDKVSQDIQDKYSNINIVRWDETLSSVAAQGNIRNFSNKKSKLDSESARIILQEYLDNNL